jgi:signal transduction histidine kinase
MAATMVNGTPARKTPKTTNFPNDESGRIFATCGKNIAAQTARQRTPTHPIIVLRLPESAMRVPTATFPFLSLQLGIHGGNLVSNRRAFAVKKSSVSVKIHSNLRWLSATGLCGLVIFAAVAFAALLQIEVNGPIYQRISLSKDLISAYVPPSESLLQAALICGMMGQASDPAELQRYADQFDAARKDFETLHTDYMHRVPEGELKDLMRGTAYQSAEQYFQIARQTYIPLILRGDHEEAQKVLLSRLKPLYDKHAAAVDEIVGVASQQALDGEALAARNVRFYTGIMAAFGALILLVGGSLSFAMARGISKQTEELQASLGQLRALAGRLQSIREEERKRVAREIHDQLGQALTAIKLDVSSLVRELPAEQRKESNRVASILKLVDETIQAVRRIATELRPGMLDDLGLVATIEWAGEEFGARTGTKCRLELPPDDIVVDQEKATAIFRIFQETLTNIARHANANEVKARLATEDGNVTLEVRDNGRGIHEEKLRKGGSLGILGMRERVTLLGGDLTITSSPGNGTAVLVRIPQGPGNQEGTKR